MNTARCKLLLSALTLTIAMSLSSSPIYAKDFPFKNPEVNKEDKHPEDARHLFGFYKGGDNDQAHHSYFQHNGIPYHQHVDNRKWRDHFSRRHDFMNWRMELYRQWLLENQYFHYYNPLDAVKAACEPLGFDMTKDDFQIKKQSSSQALIQVTQNGDNDNSSITVNVTVQPSSDGTWKITSLN